MTNIRKEFNQHRTLRDVIEELKNDGVKEIIRILMPNTDNENELIVLEYSV